MGHLCISICRVESEEQPDTMTELYRIDLPAPDPEKMEPTTGLDEMEDQILTTGQEVMRHLLVAQWEEIDKVLVEQYRQLFSP